jgi:hypothetical protein
MRKDYKKLLIENKKKFDLEQENKMVQEAEKQPYTFLHNNISQPALPCPNSIHKWEIHFKSIIN